MAMRTRLLKEARVLAGPAGLILTVTALALLRGPADGPAAALRSLAIGLGSAGFYLGTAVLVALPFGAEFQHKTMVLLLAQPVSRLRLWLEKWVVLAVVIAVMGVVEFASLQAGPYAGRPMPGAWMFLVAMTCSGMFWTLVAGSTIGGVAFSLAGLMVPELVWTVVWLIWGHQFEPLGDHPVMNVSRVTYAAVTAWLGWRTFRRYQVRSTTGSVAGDALGGSGVLGFVRCRPSGVLANLVRKELRLHQPTFLLAAMFVVCWLAAMAVFAILPGRPRAADVVFSLLTFVYVPLALVVAGTVPIGEEGALGVRAWQLSLPVSARVQWVIKLGTTLFVSAALFVGLPMLLLELAPLAVDLPGGVMRMPTSPIFFVGLGAAIVAAFWAASLLGHTVRAGAATGAAILGLTICATAADLAGRRLGLGSDLLTGFMVRNQLPPDAFFHPALNRWGMDLAASAAVCAIALLALAQSCAAFKRVDVDRRQMARYSGQLVLLTFVLAFGFATYVHAAGRQYASAPVRELNEALRSTIARQTLPPGAEWHAVTLQDLVATGQLSGPTQRWLRDSTIAVKRSPRSQTALVRVTFPGDRDYREILSLAGAPL